MGENPRIGLREERNMKKFVVINDLVIEKDVIKSLAFIPKKWRLWGTSSGEDCERISVTWAIKGHTQQTCELPCSREQFEEFKRQLTEPSPTQSDDRGTREGEK